MIFEQSYLNQSLSKFDTINDFDLLIDDLFRLQKGMGINGRREGALSSGRQRVVT